MTDSEIKEILKDVMHGIINHDEELDESLDFKNDLGLDSLDITEIIMEAEVELNVALSPEDIVKCHTVGDTIEVIKNLINQ